MTRYAALLALLAACEYQPIEWQRDRSESVQVRLVDMPDDEAERVFGAAEQWELACGRAMFVVVAADQTAAHAVNVTLGETDDGMASTRCVSDRCSIEFHESVIAELLAVHELGHVLARGGYEGPDPYHSADPESVMHGGWLTGDERITVEDIRVACSR